MSDLFEQKPGWVIRKPSKDQTEDPLGFKTIRDGLNNFLWFPLTGNTSKARFFSAYCNFVKRSLDNTKLFSRLQKAWLVAPFFYADTSKMSYHAISLTGRAEEVIEKIKKNGMYFNFNLYVRDLSPFDRLYRGPMDALGLLPEGESKIPSAKCMDLANEFPDFELIEEGEGPEKLKDMKNTAPDFSFSKSIIQNNEKKHLLGLFLNCIDSNGNIDVGLVNKTMEGEHNIINLKNNPNNQSDQIFKENNRRMSLALVLFAAQISRKKGIKHFDENLFYEFILNNTLSDNEIHDVHDIIKKSEFYIPHLIWRYRYLQQAYQSIFEILMRMVCKSLKSSLSKDKIPNFEELLANLTVFDPKIPDDEISKAIFQMFPDIKTTPIYEIKTKQIIESLLKGELNETNSREFDYSFRFNNLIEKNLFEKLDETIDGNFYYSTYISLLILIVSFLRFYWIYKDKKDVGTWCAHIEDDLDSSSLTPNSFMKFIEQAYKENWDFGKLTQSIFRQHIIMKHIKVAEYRGNNPYFEFIDDLLEVDRYRDLPGYMRYENVGRVRAVLNLLSDLDLLEKESFLITDIGDKVINSFCWGKK